MPSLFVYGKSDLQVDQQRVSMGSLEKAATITVTGEKFDRIESVANATNTTMYSDNLGAFKFLGVQSDYDIRVKITDNTANSFSFHVSGTSVANRYGAPTKFTSDKSTSASARITTIQVFNTSGSTAKVRLLAVN